MTMARRSFFGFLSLFPFIARAAAQEPAVPRPDGPAETVEDRPAAHANVAALRRYYDAFNAGRIDDAVAFFALDTRNHGRVVGRPGLSRVLTELRTLFPDYSHELVEISATGDVVVSRNRVSGTHRGVGRLPVEGGMLVGVQPTGRAFTVQHIHWWRFRDGLIEEHYACRDDVAMMAQLGLLPAHAG